MTRSPREQRAYRQRIAHSIGCGASVLGSLSAFAAIAAFQPGADPFDSTCVTLVCAMPGAVLWAGLALWASE